jgi:ribosomal protein L7/L12
MASGGVSPDTTPRCWYFELPRARDTLDAWRELLPRIMFDINTSLRRREPTDAAWIDLESMRVSPFQPRQLLQMDETNQRSVAWVNFDRARSWEPAVCYYVNDAGRYDIMSAHDFTELLLHRLLGLGEITPEQFVSFLDRYYEKPSTGQMFYADGERRLRNLTTIRESAIAYHKTPHQQPSSCCPDAVASWVGTSQASIGVPQHVTFVGGAEARADDGTTASVYLESIGTSLIQVVVALRDFRGLSIAGAKQLAESAPAIVLENAPRSEAERLCRELKRVGATASLR